MFHSPLLRLPKELRNRVLFFVFGGGRLLHIYRQLITLTNGREEHVGTELKWLTELCKAPEKDSSKSKGSSPSDTEMSLFENEYLTTKNNIGNDRWVAHSPWEEHPSEAVLAKGETIDLRVLRTCRQVYCEANLMMWTTPTFFFTNGYAFRDFVSNRTGPQKSMLRKLHLQIQAGYYSTWQQGLRNCQRALTSLTELHLEIDLLEEPSRIEEDGVPVALDELICETLHFKTFPLKRAIVHFPLCVHRPSGAVQHFHETEYTKEAASLEAQLLDPKSTVNWQEQCQERIVRLKRRQNERRRRRRAHRSLHKEMPETPRTPA